MLPLSIVLIVFGALYLLFAFIAPPQAVAHFFRIPGLFVFLPERLQAPIGRGVAGTMCIGVAIFLLARFG